MFFFQYLYKILSMVYEQLQRAIERYPNNIMIVEIQGKSITYRSFDDAITLMEENLRKLGFGYGSKLLIASVNNIDIIAAFYAVAKIGGIFIPVDPILSKVEFHNMVTDARANLVFVHESMALKYPDFKDGEPLNKSFSSKHGKLFYKQTNLAYTPTSEKVGPQTEFFHLYSSGSSGKPKGARLTQENIYYQCEIWAKNADIRSTDKFMCGMPISHSHGLTVSFPTFAVGGCLHYVDAMTLVPPRAFDYIEKHAITLVSGVPYFFKVLLNYHEDIRAKIKSLRKTICGSAPMSENLGIEFYKKYGIHICQAFGISEIGLICLNHMEDNTSKYGSVGKVFPEFQYKIVDEQLNPVKKGERGHFLVQSKGLAIGYSNAPEEEKKMFVNGWFHTQDIVEEDQHGNIYVIGRISNFINVNGNKVFPAEVEKVILGLENVKDCAVMAEKDEQAGELVRAFIVPSSPITTDEIRAHCLKFLTSFKIPRIIDIVDELPHSSTGKVMYNKINKKLNTQFEEALEDEDLVAY